MCQNARGGGGKPNPGMGPQRGGWWGWVGGGRGCCGLHGCSWCSGCRPAPLLGGRAAPCTPQGLSTKRTKDGFVILSNGGGAGAQLEGLALHPGVFKQETGRPGGLRAQWARVAAGAARLRNVRVCARVQAKGCEAPCWADKGKWAKWGAGPCTWRLFGGGAPPGLRKGVGEGTWTRKDGLDVTHRGFRPRGRRPPAPGRGPLRCRRLEPGAGTAARSCKHGYSVRAGDAGKAIRGLRGLGTGHARACAGPPARLMGGLRGAPLTSPWARGPPRATSPCQWPGT